MLRMALAALMAVTAHTAALAGDWQKIVNPAGLQQMLGGDVVVLDIRTPKEFKFGHVPGALSAPYGQWRGPKENPGRALDDAALTGLLQGLGIDPDDRVVVTYGGRNETDFGSAARVYWTLKSAGLSQIAILNGGYSGWTKAGMPISVEVTTVEPSDATYSLSRDWMLDRQGVADVLNGKRDAIMVDARPASFWKGDKKHAAAAAAGTLEGSLNITHNTWFSGSKTEIVTGPRVMELARAAGYVPGDTELVSFCNTGHWAATNWFALSELAGIKGVKLYPESMVGWTRGGGAVVNGG